MGKEFPGFVTLAVEAALELGVDLLRDAPNDRLLYDKWEFHIPLQSGLKDHYLVYEITYHLPDGNAISEVFSASYCPWPPDQQAIKQYKSSVKDAISTLQQRIDSLTN